MSRRSKKIHLCNEEKHEEEEPVGGGKRDGEPGAVTKSTPTAFEERMETIPEMRDKDMDKDKDGRQGGVLLKQKGMKKKR